MNGNVFDIDGKSPTLTTNKGEGSKVGCLVIGKDPNIKFESTSRIHSDDGKSPCLMVGKGGGNGQDTKSGRG